MSIASLYPSINPSLLLDFANVKRLDPRITFVRTTTATYYDGVTTAKAEENLLTYSQEFDNAAWTKYKASITANSTTAPDGTATASTLTENNENFQHIVYRNNVANIIASGSVASLSVYAKANTRSWINLNLYDGSNRLTWFDLTNGVVGTNAAGNTATITSVGSGWYRCAISRTISNGAVFSSEYGIASGDNVYAYLGNGTSSIYIWGAQLEQRSSATAYTATTSQAITNYIPVLQTASAGQARFDHNPTTGESLGLLIEEARTNLATYSSQFSNVAWTKTACSFTSTANVAPDGTLTAQQLVEDTSTNVRYVQSNSISFVSGTSYTSTIYVKANGRSIFFTYFDSTAFPSSGRIAWFDIANQTTQVQTGVTASITAVGNGWYRCSCTATANASASAYAFQMGIPSQTLGSVSSYTGNGFSGLFLWGAQVETGSFATSYIPTTTASATRNADAASMTGTNFSSWFNNGEGTVYAENSFIGVGSSSYPGVCKFSDGTISNRFGMYGRPSGAGYGAVMTAIGSTAASLEPISGSTATAINTYSRLSYGYKVNDFGATRNASTVTTDTSGNVAVGVNQLNIGLYDEYMNGTIKKLAYYPIRVTNAQLQALSV